MEPEREHTRTNAHDNKSSLSPILWDTRGSASLSPPHTEIGWLAHNALARRRPWISTRPPPDLRGTPRRNRPNNAPPKPQHTHAQRT